MYNQAIELNSADGEARFNRGNIYFKMGRNDEAIADLKKMLEPAPEDEKVYVSIGLLFQKKKDFKESIDWFGKAINQKPSIGEYWLLRSQSWYEIGDKVKARDDAMKAKSMGVKADEKILELII